MVYEFSITQAYRHFLRVEQSFFHIENLLAINNGCGYQASFNTLCQLLGFLSRVDLKSEIIKDLELKLQKFLMLQHNPKVDNEKLERFIRQIRGLLEWAINHQGRLGDDLRLDEFFVSNLGKQSLLTGITSNDAAELSLFFIQPTNVLKQQFVSWLTLLEGLKTSIRVILGITRDLAEFTTVNSSTGDFVIDSLNPVFSLIRIKIHGALGIFPTVSAGKHRIALQFYKQNKNLAKIRVSDPLQFQYSLCS